MSSPAVVLGDLLGNPWVLKTDLCHKLSEQANNQRLFLENDYFFPKYNSRFLSYCIVENISDHIRQIAFRCIAKSQVHFHGNS